MTGHDGTAGGGTHGPSADATVARLLRRATPAGPPLGTGRLGLGSTALTGLQALAGIAFFVDHWRAYSNPTPIVAAWLLYAIAAVGIAVNGRRRGRRMASGAFAVTWVVLAAVVALDFIGIWPEHDIADTATASLAAGFALLPLATLRPTREIVLAVVTLGTAFVVMTALSSPISHVTVPGDVTMLAIALIPGTIGIVTVYRFRRMVRRELGRVLVAATDTGSRPAVGMRASEELARLDLAAEKLFDDVAVGTEPLPLSPESSSRAAQLATDFRLLLIEGHRETWLSHAVAESDLLAYAVRVADPGALAGTLDRAQRDALLQALWLLAADADATAAGPDAPVSVTLERVGVPSPRGGSVDRITRPTIRIVLESRQTPTRRLSPGARAMLQRLGTYSDTARNGVTRAVVDCDAATPRPT